MNSSMKFVTVVCMWLLVFAALGFCVDRVTDNDMSYRDRASGECNFRVRELRTQAVNGWGIGDSNDAHKECMQGKGFR